MIYSGVIHPSTLELLQFLLLSSDKTVGGHGEEAATNSNNDLPLMIIGCYRDNEVDKDHILTKSINQIPSTKRSNIFLKELSMRHVTNLVGGLLNIRVSKNLDDIDFDNMYENEKNEEKQQQDLITDDNDEMSGLFDLTKVVCRKTSGNPYFTLQFFWIF